jgi:hypothetical protein
LASEGSFLAEKNVKEQRADREVRRASGADLVTDKQENIVYCTSLEDIASFGVC